MFCKRAVLVLLPNARAEFDLLPKTLLRSQNTFFVKSFSLKRRTADEQSFTVSYLISSCGLSPETALHASQKVHFRSAEQPDSVLSLLRNHGFTNTHISKLARIRPYVLSADPKKTLLPKLEFLQSIVGFPTADLANILSSAPNILEYSLNNRLIPLYDYLKNVMLLDDKQIRKTLKISIRSFGRNLEKDIVPRIAVLRELGFTASNLSFLMTSFPQVLLCNPNRFDKAVKDVVELGLNPSKCTFICVLKMMLRTSKSTWERKMEVYRKCGWSEDDFQLAFKKYPLCMRISEKKILSAMDFLVNKMGWKPIAIARVPTVLNYSLEKRTIPRCLVIKVLILKGLIEKDVCCSTVVIKNDKYFLDKFVTKYEEDVPQLLDIFNGKVGLAELGFESSEIGGRKLL